MLGSAPVTVSRAGAAEPIVIRAISAWPMGCNCVTQYISRTASLTTFLLGVESHHAADSDVKPHLRLFRCAEARSGHRWGASRFATAFKWSEIKEMISLAEGILKGYFHAFHGADYRFVLANVDSELDSFLKWCRLDDYAGHRTKEREVRRAAIEEARRRREGDPTALERHPI